MTIPRKQDNRAESCLGDRGNSYLRLRAINIRLILRAAAFVSGIAVKKICAEDPRDDLMNARIEFAAPRFPVGDVSLGIFPLRA